jgi:predicted NACHT family NTPase
LAYWIYTDSKRQAGVLEGELIDQTANHFMSRRFNDEYEAREAARDFVHFCRGRAWVFSDTGMTASGTPLYQFTHRTFLEYFTAAHLTRVHRDSDSLSTVLLPHI